MVGYVEKSFFMLKKIIWLHRVLSYSRQFKIFHNEVFFMNSISQQFYSTVDNAKNYLQNTWNSLTEDQKKVVYVASAIFSLITLVALIYKSKKTTITVPVTVPVQKYEREGVFTCLDNKIEKGLFSNGKLEGQGEVTFPDGKIMVGKFIEGIFHEGEILFPNKKKMIGTFNYDFSILKGKIVYQSGETDEGTFRNNKLIQGTYCRNDGAKLEGSFYDEDLHGNGKITYADGKVEEGWFSKGKLVRNDL